MILGLDVLLLEKTNHFFLELTGPLARYDLDDWDSLFYGFINDSIEFSINLPSLVIDFVEVEYEFGHLGIVWAKSTGDKKRRI